MCNTEMIAPLLLKWYDVHRRTLPWREDVSPYRTWVSETMLQQTRVQAVVPYFQRFMEAAPEVSDLASLPEEQLLSLWQGLGYYNRARNLHRAAREMAAKYGGRVPDDYGALTSLAGIGDYTAGAILSIAYGQRVPAVDGNVLRIAARLTGRGDNVLEPSVRSSFRDWIETALPEERAGDFNQALMDLGAMVCLPKAPDCENCPLSPLCTARRENRQNALPVREKKSKRRTEQRTVLLLEKDGRIALRKRCGSGLLAGLWELPNVEGTLDEGQIAALLAQHRLSPVQWHHRREAKHIFTHLTWEMTVYRLAVTGDGAPDWTWCSPEDRGQYPMATAFSKLLTFE